MQKILLADDNFLRSYNRSSAFGHKRLVIDEDVKVMHPVKMFTDGDDLRMCSVEPDDTSEEYIIICKEFGLAGYHKKLQSKISVIFLDGGWMVVTLVEGGAVLRLNDRLIMPTVGEYELTSVSEEDIFWVNSTTLMSYRKYLDDKASFVWDYEFMFTLKGGMLNGMSSFSFGKCPAEDIDISLGYIAQFQQRKEMQAQMRETNRVMSLFKGTGTDSGNGFVFDDDDEFDDGEDEEYEDDDYDGDW